MSLCLECLETPIGTKRSVGDELAVLSPERPVGGQTADLLSESAVEVKTADTSMTVSDG